MWKRKERKKKASSYNQLCSFYDDPRLDDHSIDEFEGAGKKKSRFQVSNPSDGV